MTSELQNIHQSGEKVLIPGVYAVINVNLDRTTALVENCLLQPGECFPDYEGRAACWHLVQALKHPTVQEPITMPWQIQQ